MEQVESNDVRFLMPKSMPAYLRIDKDIKQQLIELSKLAKEYSKFDVIGLDHEINRKLELQLDRQSTEYKNHHKEFKKKLTNALASIEDSILLKDDIIRIRKEK